MDDYMDMDCDDYFDTHYEDDLLNWEEEQVFQDMCLDREDEASAWDAEYEATEDEWEEWED